MLPGLHFVVVQTFNMKLSIQGFLCLVSIVGASGPIPVSRSGLAGIDGFTFYNPYCGHGCFRSFSAYTLSCSTIISAGGHTTADSAAQSLALCRASNYPYLSSIAWCMHLYCPEDVRASTIEHFWETQITGDVNILPQWSYGEVMANITEPPTMLPMEMDMTTDMTLNMTMLTTYDNWQATWITLYYFFRETSLESYYGYVVDIFHLLSFTFHIISRSNHSTLNQISHMPHLIRSTDSPHKDGISTIRDWRVGPN